MNVSPAGRAFIEDNEGCSLGAYWDVDGYSIGYGHHGAGVTADLQITREQADAFLAHDLVWVEAAITSTITVPLTQHQFDALADFIYNEGPGALRTSTLARLINSGVTDPDRIRMAFCMWDKARNAGGDLVDNTGLLHRRQAEAEMFLTNASDAG